MFRTRSQIRWGRAILTAIVANIVTLASLGLLFGNPLVERLVYSDQAGQSAKAIAIWLELEPLPAVTPFWDSLLDFSTRRLAVQGLLLLWSLGQVVIYAKIESSLGGNRVRKGAMFGIGAWWVLWLFFEPWVPFNMFGEPIGLMALELSLELVAMVATGIAIALMYGPTHSDGQARPTCCTSFKYILYDPWAPNLPAG